MPSDIQDTVHKILKFLYDREKTFKDHIYVEAKDVKDGTGLTETEVNDAVELLHESGLVERLQTLGTAPYNFNSVLITARGKYEYERRKSIEGALISSGAKIPETGPGAALSEIEYPSLVALLQFLSRSAKPPIPEGSPYGFKEEDWEYVSKRKAQKNTLQIVLGCKFQSSHYNTDELKKKRQGDVRASCQSLQWRKSRSGNQS